MNKRLTILVVVALLSYLLVTPSVSAKMVLYGPQDMIERSSLIVDATVVESTIEKTALGGKQLVGRFKVNTILKGNSVGSSFTVASSRAGKGDYMQQIPSPGTEVMVLLAKGPTESSRNPSVHFIADDNNIAIIKDGKVVD
ncbi:MAG: hypothetical protein IBX64_10245, partial [Actinobacteria bacterium]|nr:hypothetical protein [Actinomycetota bacterium]